jgi:ARG/rhodanese/phosphatase superfamily protein
VAVRGEIIWADLFADNGLLARYWVKLVRSYAAEGLTTVGGHRAEATVAQAQRFLDMPMHGEEKSTGEVGVCRTLESQAGMIDQFVLESLLPGLHEEVHVSRVKVNRPASMQPVDMLR